MPIFRRRPLARAAWIILSVLVSLLQTGMLEAGECAAPAGAAPALAPLDAVARLRFLRSSLRATARQEQWYLIGWTSIYGGLAAGSWLLVPLSADPGNLIDAGWSSATSLAAAGLAIIDPVLTMRDSQKLERLLAQAGKDTASCAVIAEAERLLAHAADNEIRARGAFNRITSILLPIGAGLIQAYALKRPDGAALNTVIGVVLGQLQVATRPTLASRSLERYRRGDLGPLPPAPWISVAPINLSTRNSWGLALAGNF